MMDNDYEKSDNSELAPKLAIRRHFLQRFHSEGPIRVFDCCQGSGLIWSILRKEIPVSSYWGVDLKPKPGRLKIDSVKVLGQPGWKENVIDIDTYGSPWKHWAAMLPNIIQPTTIFLTAGQLMMGTDAYFAQALRLGNLPIPQTIMMNIAKKSLSYVLTYSLGDLKIIYAAEAKASGSARYFGVHLAPQETHNGRQDSDCVDRPYF